MEGRILNLATLKEKIERYKLPFLLFGGLLIGFSVSSGLLLYSGKELVNVLIYIFFVVILPALFSILSFLLLFFRREAKIIHRVRESFLFGFFFSVGALIALLVTVTIKDLAFGWATTLHVTPKELQSFLNSMAIWKSICSSCIVSHDLVTVSQFTRLGNAVNSEQVAKAKELGEWWKFLAMSILFYGIFLRALFWLASGLFRRQSKVTFESSRNSDSFEGLQKSYRQPTKREALYGQKFQLVGYDVDNLEALGLPSDREAKDIVIAVNAWEPPILEFFDYVEELQKQGKKISLLLLGVDGKEPSLSDIAIWQDKLLELGKEYEVIV